jgi:hypothetical protein
MRSETFAPGLPHVVVLGAGASKAALPAGDKTGRMIPLMDDLPKILGEDWERLVHSADPPPGNFESTFSWIRCSGRFDAQLSHIEEIIESYFSNLELPDHPSIYDYLVLGLRAKDVIATFNWDPFLMQAHQRNRSTCGLPDIRFLHGNVASATCREHDVLGAPTESCPFCWKRLERGRLFFPDANKDYAKDSIVHRDWSRVTAQLKKAFHLTIFGYSGPATDFNARKLLLHGWGQTPMRDFNHVEMIDTADDDVLRSRWDEFIPYDHEMIVRDFWDSSIARWPRRTAEWKIAASFYGVPTENLGPFRTDSICDLQTWFGRIAAADRT